jgi:ubiquinone/menaquinone biosynthesis C-methylase UbiE
MKKRSHRYEKMARVYDDEILPVWSQRFGRMLLRNLEVPRKSMVLDVGCGTGYPSLELLKRMEEGRIIAIDPVGPLLDVARKKAGELAGKRIFFRTEPPVAKLAFADDVYDLVVSNLGLLLLDDPARAVREFARVTKPNGHVIVTLPVAGTYTEFFDIYREVLTKNDKDALLLRLERHVTQIPDVDEVTSWFEQSGLSGVDVEVEQFSLLFKSSREFFFAPVIEFGPLAAWKDVAGKGEEMQEIFWHIKEAIDAYFSDRAFEITVKAGCFRAVKPVSATPTTEQETKTSRPRTGEIKVSRDEVETKEISPLQRRDFHLDDEEEEEDRDDD